MTANPDIVDDGRDGEGIVPAAHADGQVAVRDTALRDRIAADWLLDQPSVNTEAAYRRDIGQYFAWNDRWQIETLTALSTHIRAYRRHLAEPAEHDGKKLAPSTQHRKIAAVSSFYQFGTENYGHLVPSNPCAQVKRPKVSSDSRTQSLTLDQLQALIAAADRAGPQEAALIRVLFYSGARVSEVCDATVPDLEWAGGCLVLWVIRKGGQPLQMTLGRADAPVVVKLREHLAGRRAGPLFPRADGLPLTRHNAAYLLAQLVRAAGIRDGYGRPVKLTPHGIRHTYVTLGLDVADDIRDVQRSVGHQKLETTMVYDRSRRSVDRSPTHALALQVEPGEPSS